MFKWLLGSNLYAKVDRLSTYAAALAYCIVLSLVPFLVVTFVIGMQFASHLDLGQDYQKVYADKYAKVLGVIIPGQDPSQTQHIFETVQTSAKGGLVTLGFILAIYTSFNLMDQINRTILFIFDDPRKPSIWSWWVSLKTLGLLFIWMCLLLLISVSAVESAVLKHLLDHLHMTTLSKAIANSTQVLVMIGALFGTLYITYYIVPERHHKKALVLEGSLLGATGWIACSLVFAYVIPELLKASAAYAALGSVVAILLWAQACAWSIIIGGCWIVRFTPTSTRAK